MKRILKFLIINLFIININLLAQNIDTTVKEKIFQKINVYIPTGYNLTPARINPLGAVYGAEFSVPDTCNIIIYINNYKTDSVVCTIRQDSFPPGNYIFNWNGLDNNGIEVESGVYILEIHFKHIDVKSNIELSFCGRTMLPIYLTKKDREFEIKR